jgi:DnaK suppressor protein
MDPARKGKGQLEDYLMTKAPRSKKQSTTKRSSPARKAIKPKRRLVSKGKRLAPVNLPSGYRPTEKEPFMSARMREYFRRKLLSWRDELMRESEETLQSLQEGGIVEPDIADRASIETDRSLELRTRDRARKLIGKIDEALERVEKGTYGYCEETGEPITISRLEARPIATLSVEAQERHERMERTHRDD